MFGCEIRCLIGVHIWCPFGVHVDVSLVCPFGISCKLRLERFLARLKSKIGPSVEINK